MDAMQRDALDRAASQGRRDPADLSPAAPAAAGLYDPVNEHDSCGVGFVANIDRKSVV